MYHKGDLKVLLTHGYFIADDPKEQVIMRPYVPLGILYISSFLEQNAISHEVFDSTFSSKKAQLEFIETYQPDYIGIYVNLMTKVNVLEIITTVKKHPTLKNIPIILGGPEVRNHVNAFLNHGAEIIVLGEGEITFYEVITSLQQNNDLFQVAGISYKLNNEIITTDYRIPSDAECFACHKLNEQPTPIGVKPQNLNIDYAYPRGNKNQLLHLLQQGYLES